MIRPKALKFTGKYQIQLFPKFVRSQIWMSWKLPLFILFSEAETGLK